MKDAEPEQLQGAAVVCREWADLARSGGLHSVHLKQVKSELPIGPPGREAGQQRL